MSYDSYLTPLLRFNSSWVWCKLLSRTGWRIELTPTATFQATLANAVRTGGQGKHALLFPLGNIVKLITKPFPMPIIIVWKKFFFISNWTLQGFYFSIVIYFKLHHWSAISVLYSYQLVCCVSRIHGMNYIL